MYQTQSPDTQNRHLCMTGGPALRRLTEDDKAKALRFLKKRPLHTFGLWGFIDDNGVASMHNRGTFYLCHDQEKSVDGVALIGHATMFEAHTEAAISTIATQARACPDVKLVLGEKEKVASFWNYFDQNARPAIREDYDLLAIDQAPRREHCESVNLRLAAPDDLDLVFNAHIQSKLEDTGVSIVKGSLSSIVERCATRIERRRTWVMIGDNEVVFKADVIAHSGEAAYLEGIWVHPGWRSKGIGFRCTSCLTSSLLENTSTVCLLVKKQNKAAGALYKKIGFKMVSPYQVIFL